MAKVGIKGLTYAKYQSGGDGNAVVYTGGKKLDDFISRADITESRSDVKEHADDHQIDSENSLDNVALAIELVNNNPDIKKDILGHVQENEELLVTGDAAPFVGIGFICRNRFKGTVTYEAYWFFKMQFSTGGVTAETRREQTNFGHETINGTGSAVVLTSGGKEYFYAHKDGLATEALARTWLNSKAGITA